ncbi:hypothetical protein [Nocardia vaccinii]|uniref:hypothetical protein n=1 Tax=Nocardia vaccinii TaxID=1822 RepID=UPI000831C28D|nr:hypothetical protein [Nocardia vaccinii]
MSEKQVYLVAHVGRRTIDSAWDNEDDAQKRVAELGTSGELVAFALNQNDGFRPTPPRTGAFASHSTKVTFEFTAHDEDEGYEDLWCELEAIRDEAKERDFDTNLLREPVVSTNTASVSGFEYDNDGGYGPGSYFMHAMSKDD